MAACAAERNGMQSNSKRPVPAVLSASVLSAARKQARKNYLPETVLLLLLLLLVARWENTMPLKDRDGPKLHPENA